MKKTFFFIIILFLSNSIFSQKLDGYFVGKYHVDIGDETNWELHFFDDGIFIKIIWGHMGNFFSGGLYSISSDTLVLNSFDSINFKYKDYKNALGEWETKFIYQGKCILLVDEDGDWPKNYCRNEDYFIKNIDPELSSFYEYCKKLIKQQ